MVVPLSLQNLTTPATADDWNTEELNVAAILGLPTTAWQPGGVERAIFATVARIQQESDVAGSVIAQAGFLDFAASGFVRYTDPRGAVQVIYVTPDPSNPAQNPTGALGWLDVLAFNLFNVRRILRTSAGGTLALLNTSGTTYGPFDGPATGNDVGAYHVSQPTAPGGPTYSNTQSLTIAPSATVATVQDTAPYSGLVEIETVAAHGLADDDAVFIAGVTGTTEANGAWYVTVIDSTHFTLQGSAFTNAFVSGGTVYTPTLAPFTADIPGTVSNASDLNTVIQPVTSLIGVSVANIDAWIGTDTESNVALAARCRLKLQSLAIGGPGGAYVYFALVAHILAPDLTPPLKLSAAITRASVLLDPWTGLVHLTIANSAGGPSGTFDTPGSDVYAVQKVEEANVGITSFTLLTQGATNHSITVAIKVFLPAAFNTSTNKDFFKTAVDTFFSTLPIGGVTDPGGDSPNTNVVPYEAVLASVNVAAAAAQIPVQNVDGTLNGARLNVQLALFPVPEVAVPNTTITLVSV